MKYTNRVFSFNTNNGVQNIEYSLEHNDSLILINEELAKEEAFKKFGENDYIGAQDFVYYKD